jgi:hypothetical protein
MSPIRLGVSDSAKSPSSIYVGVGGVAKNVKKVYAGVEGKAKLVWPNESSSGKVYYGVNLYGYIVYASVASVTVKPYRGMPTSIRLFAELKNNTKLEDISSLEFDFFNSNTQELVGQITIDPSGITKYLDIETVQAGKYHWTLSSDKKTIQAGLSLVSVYSLTVETPYGAESSLYISDTVCP